MNNTELRQQAVKYQVAALLLGSPARERYEQRARELLALASQQQPPPAPPPPAQLAPAPKPTPPPALISLSSQTKIHQKLALAVLADKRAGIKRAFSLWLTLRSQERCWFYLSDIITFFASCTGSDPRNVRRWINSGNNIFWCYGKANGKATLSLFGRDRVFSNYRLSKPGRVFLLETSQLLGKLQSLHAALYALWIDKQSRWASRATIETITTIGERSQRRYDNVSKQHKQQTFAIDWGNGQARRLPNRYSAKFYPAFYNQDKTQKRHNLYMPECNRLESDPLFNVDNSPTCCNTQQVGIKTGKPMRILFDDPNAAIARAAERAKAGLTGQVFSVFSVSKFGNILLKTHDYALAL